MTMFDFLTEYGEAVEEVKQEKKERDANIARMKSKMQQKRW